MKVSDERMKNNDAIKSAILGTTIALQVREQIREGRGAPDERDMARFQEEAEAVVELWVEHFDAFCLCGHLHREHHDEQLANGGTRSKCSLCSCCELTV